jgi:hypothetical protein
MVHKLVQYCLDSRTNCLAVKEGLSHWDIFYMLKYLQNYCLRRCPSVRPQNIDRSANKMVMFTNRPYIDTYLTEPDLRLGYFQPSGRVVRASGTHPINMLMYPALSVMHAPGVLRNEGLLSVSPRLII